MTETNSETASAGGDSSPAPCSAIPASAIKVMCEAWTEMNTIRARDGVPYMHNGYKSDVSQEYWDDIMQRLDDAVKSATGRGCWLHPSLYSPNS